LQGVGISPSSCLRRASGQACLSVLLTRPDFCKSGPQRQDVPSRLAFEARHAITSILHDADYVLASFNRSRSRHMYSVSYPHVALNATSHESRNNRTVSRTLSPGQSISFGDFCLLAQCGLDGSTDHQQRSTATRQAHACSCM
jgi:hypothetical protein